MVKEILISKNLWINWDLKKNMKIIWKRIKNKKKVKNKFLIFIIIRLLDLLELLEKNKLIKYWQKVYNKNIYNMVLEKNMFETL